MEVLRARFRAWTKSWKKVLDPNVPTELRVAHFLGAYMQSIDIIALGGAARAQVQNRARAHLSKMAAEMFDDPKIQQTLTSCWVQRIFGARAKQLKDLKYGEAIPLEVMDELGYTSGQIQALRKIAEENGYRMRFRTTNVESARFINDLSALPKPLDVKFKTINDKDVWRRRDRRIETSRHRRRRSSGRVR